VRWSRPLDNWVRARPAVTRRGVVAATISGRAFAFSPDGAPQWEATVSPHPIYADLAATPDRIVFSDSNLLSFCLDADGTVQWTRSHLPAWTDAEGRRIFTDQLSGGTYYQSKPTAYRGKIFFGTPAGFLHAVDARSGKELWKFEMGGGISVAPACVDGKVYAGQQGGERFFYCLDAETGALVWKQTLPGGWVWGSATVDDGLVFVPTVNGYAVCLDGRTGHIVWMYPMAKTVPAEPAIEGDLVYFGSWSRSLYAFKKRTGEIVWKHNGVALDSGTLIAYGGSIYLPHHANMFLQLDAATGAVLSEGITDAHAKGRFSDFNATPAFHDGRAFFSARGSIGLRGAPLFSTLYCVDPAAGRVLWTHPDGGGLSAPAIANGRVYIASGNTPFLYCLDAATGTTRWVYRMGHRVEEATLCIYQDRVFALAADGYVHAIQ
jgi:outer membrane protein assembly factor BamB